MTSAVQTAGSNSHGNYNGRALAAVVWLTLSVAGLRAQSLPPLPVPPRPSIAISDAPPTPIHQPTLPPMPLVRGTELDRVMAIVNDDLILDSDINQEQRLAALFPYGSGTKENSRQGAGGEARAAAIERLINRDLILQQMKLQPGSEVTEDAATKNLDALRKTIPACKQYQCETDAGWNRFLASAGFTPASLLPLWQQRMDVLAFIDQRFRMGITITSEQIKNYYDNVLLKEYAARHASPPPLAAISSRVQEVLLQQQVTNLLDGWLNSLRAQGSIAVLHPGEGAP
jgi:peptidyl-prolyl cis-trans isomerase SurA